MIKEQDKAYVSIHDDLKFIDDNSFCGQVKGMVMHIYHYDKNGNLINQVTKVIGNNQNVCI